MSDLKTQNSETKIVKSPSRHFPYPFEDMERLFENFSTRGWLRPFHWDMPAMDELITTAEKKIPCVDVIDRDAEILVKAELPGVDKKDLDITVTNNSVTIRGKTSHEEKEEKGNYYRCEISRGAYVRSVTLPADVDESKSKAKFKDGMLEITLPKMEKTKHHTIKVE
ncbi:MAG: Hsp20/alpha crystallin family protein [Gammaproteobacteria bacterium]|nr:Hsp20/alpha crystallin family protein [Gammaproteobacteria bacterium]